jgi:hypothetical protein
MRGVLCWTSPSLISAFVGHFRYGEEQGAYSPQCVEEVFSEVPHRPGPMQGFLCRVAKGCAPYT